MNKTKKINDLRKKLKNKKPSIGSWIQIDNSDSAELLASSGYEWIAVDLEHGNISTSNIANIFRSIELQNCIPFVRVGSHDLFKCKQALDLGALGLILPNINDHEQLETIIYNCTYPPNGRRGVGFCRANLYGKEFNNYKKFAQKPFFVAMIEDAQAIGNIEKIVNVNGLDAIFIGPYDLSASLGCIGDFKSKKFTDALNKIRVTSARFKIPTGIHVVKNDKTLLKKYINQGYTFISYSMDSIFLSENFIK